MVVVVVGASVRRFGLLSFASPPSASPLLPAALSFGLSRSDRESGMQRSSTIKEETSKRADKCTCRLKSWRTAGAHQFVNSTIFNRVIAPLPPNPSQSLSVSLPPLFIILKRGCIDVSIRSGQPPERTAKQIKLNPFLTPLFQANQTLVLIAVKLSSVYLYPFVILSSLFTPFVGIGMSWSGQIVR